MIIKFVMKFLPTCLPSGLTVAAPDAFGRIPGVMMAVTLYKYPPPLGHYNQNKSGSYNGQTDIETEGKR